MADAMVEHHVDGIVRRCYVGIDAVSLRLEVLRRLRSLMTIDAAFFATVDPATMLFTSAVSEEPLIAAAPLFLDNELGRTDVNRFSDLAVSVDPVASLDSATRGDRPASTRYNEIMAPMGLGDELRVALRTGDRCWGVMCLHREDTPHGFSARDAAIVRRLAPHLAEGLRRSVLLQPPVTVAPGPSGPGILVLDDKLSVVSANAAAEWWLADITETDWPGSAELPLTVYAAVAQLARLEADSQPVSDIASIRLRTGTGQWLALHASRLSGPNGAQTAVVLEPATPTQLASMFLDAHGLTPAQVRVAGLVLQGRSTNQIVRELRISAHTVQEHLTGVFDKLGVRSRRELVAALLVRPS
ncbi:MAG: LuxR C-terminal-related transcriptional regulator [Actinomycetota bacterium]|nr:LuxR C-terminal-related transcriptional regulator [Actinomycetota bacterium]